MSPSPRIPITRLSLGEAEARAAAAVVRSGWVGQGEQTAAFERAVAAFVGARQAVAVSSGTAALHLGLVALGLGPGDEVILPSLSFIASANVIRYVGATPVFVEVDGRTFTLDPREAARAVTPRTRALMPVHQLGWPVAREPLRELAERHRLHLVEDGACALGAARDGRRVGGGTAAGVCCFSFHPRKVITTGEGGMITTDDEALAARLRLLRNQGVSLPAEARHGAARVVEEAYPCLGFNYRLTDIQAAIGLEQMQRLPALLAARRHLARRYDEGLEGLAGVTPPLAQAGVEHAFQSYLVLLDEALDRGAMMQQLLDRGIATRRLTAIHQTAAYREQTGALRLPVTEAVARRSLLLPLFPSLTEAEQDEVIAALGEVCLPR